MRIIGSLNRSEIETDPCKAWRRERLLDAAWFEPQSGAIENIRVADELLIDVLFAANGETYETVQPHVRVVEIEGVKLRVLDIDGLLKTKTDYREKDVLDKRVLERIKLGLQPD